LWIGCLAAPLRRGLFLWYCRSLPELPAEWHAEDTKVTGSLVPFDTLDVFTRCNELLRRMSLMTDATGSIPYKWDILEFLEESRDRLNDIRQANCSNDMGSWQEISEVLGNENTACTLPMGLRKQCEELEVHETPLHLPDLQAC